MYQHSGKRARGRGQAGFTLLEVVIAMVVLLVSLGGMMASVLSSERLNQSNAERDIAVRAATSQLELLQEETFRSVFANFNGATFDVPGLDPQPGAAGVGTFEFPTNGGVLREDVVDPGLGMPRDLTGDGVIDGDDHSGDYEVLPVRVRVAWQGVAGAAQVELQTFLCDWGL